MLRVFRRSVVYRSYLTKARVKGDGATDDSASLNAILAQNAAQGRITYFPYGVYVLRNTLHVPSGSRIVGEAWPVLSGRLLQGDWVCKC